MLNSEPASTGTSKDEAVAEIVASGPIGAALLAGLTTAAVLAMWLAFYFFVFVPRSLP
jgi:asparagine N-glycosylation enzyme membrane subunit Stt3